MENTKEEKIQKKIKTKGSQVITRYLRNVLYEALNIVSGTARDIFQKHKSLPMLHLIPARARPLRLKYSQRKQGYLRNIYLNQSYSQEGEKVVKRASLVGLMSCSWQSSEWAFEHLWSELPIESAKDANRDDALVLATAFPSALQFVPCSASAATPQAFTAVHTTALPASSYLHSVLTSDTMQDSLPNGIPPDATSASILTDAPEVIPAWRHVDPLDSGFVAKREPKYLTGLAHSTRLRIKAPTYVFGHGQQPLITRADNDGSETQYSNSSADGQEDMSTLQESSDREVEILNPLTQVQGIDASGNTSPTADSEPTQQRTSPFLGTRRVSMMVPSGAPEAEFSIPQVPTIEIENAETSATIGAKTPVSTIAEITTSAPTLVPTSTSSPESETFHPLNMDSIDQTTISNGFLSNETPCDIISNTKCGNINAIDLLCYQNPGVNDLLESAVPPVKSSNISAAMPERHKPQEAEILMAAEANKITTMPPSTMTETTSWKGIDGIRLITSKGEKDDKRAQEMNGCRWPPRRRRLWRQLRQSQVDAGPHWWWNGNMQIWDRRSKEDIVGGIYINGMLTDPRQTSESPLSERHGRKEKLKKPSRFCHICLRRAERVAAAACARLATAHCRKVICRRCFEEQGWDWSSATKRNSGWTCSHCQNMYVEKKTFSNNNNSFAPPLRTTPQTFSDSSVNHGGLFVCQFDLVTKMSVELLDNRHVTNFYFLV